MYVAVSALLFSPITELLLNIKDRLEYVNDVTLYTEGRTAYRVDELQGTLYVFNRTSQSGFKLSNEGSSIEVLVEKLKLDNAGITVEYDPRNIDTFDALRAQLDL